MLFGKNSDRQRNEAQAVEYHPASDHGDGASLKCTYVTIAQAPHTHAVLLCRPFWMWGAEMGANEHGVAIGNEALYARSAAPLDVALTGMDLVRLALERSSNATEAVAVITQLLERYGQGGNCGHLEPSHYNNGFMIADPTEAYVLETVGREWLVERVAGVRAMSNRYSIEHAVHSASAGLLSLVRAWGANTQCNFADTLADPNREHIGNAAARRARTTALLQAGAGALTAAEMISILRTHGTDLQWTSSCSVQRTVCMHAGTADRYGQTVGSMVSELRREHAIHWVTGTAAPCISIFKPVLMNIPLPSRGPLPTDRYDPATLWWQHERLHRAALTSGFAAFLERVQDERDELEASFRTQIRGALAQCDASRTAGVVAACWRDASAAEARWYKILECMSGPEHPVADEWRELSVLAGLVD